MTEGDWERVIGQAADLGVGHVVFIGGEPTLHPALERLVRLTVGLGLDAEVYSNLVHVSPALWELFSEPGVSLAVSWYSGDRTEHTIITGGRDTWRQTRANIAEAVRRGIPVRVGLVDGIVPGQRSGEGERELRELGVVDVGRDWLREFGRGTRADAGQACGSCGRGIAAVLPDGSVAPCPLTRWLRAGNVGDAPLGEIVGGPLAAVTSDLRKAFDAACNPDCQPACAPGGLCSPRCRPNSECRPDCGPNCGPQCVPNTACRPACSPSACRPSTR
jgi:MoaA/NifB/PqqE/SkfB family radical SAM enzyme